MPAAVERTQSQSAFAAACRPMQLSGVSFGSLCLCTKPTQTCLSLVITHLLPQARSSGLSRCTNCCALPPAFRRALSSNAQPDMPQSGAAQGGPGDAASSAVTRGMLQLACALMPRLPGLASLLAAHRPRPASPWAKFALQVVRVQAADIPGDFSIPAAPILIPEGPWKEIEGCVCAPKGFKAQGGYRAVPEECNRVTGGHTTGSGNTGTRAAGCRGSCCLPPACLCAPVAVVCHCAAGFIASPVTANNRGACLCLSCCCQGHAQLVETRGTH